MLFHLNYLWRGVLTSNFGGKDGGKFALPPNCLLEMSHEAQILNTGSLYLEFFKFSKNL